MRIEWIATEDALDACIDRWRQHEYVGFDTEFIRVRTFYPAIALYQVAAAGECTLIDPLAVAGFVGFRRWLTDPATTLVMHACSEDLEVIQHHLGVLPAAIYDTQLAASFVGRDHSLGYQALVRRELQVELQKGETRSDWLRRPLSPEQRRYAAEDVDYLPPLREGLQQQLRQRGRLAWAAQEMHRLRDGAALRRAGDYYTGVRDAWRLQPRQLAVFRAVCLWREETARRRDRPRGHIVGDDVLLDIARRGVARGRDLSALLSPAAGERYADELLAIIEAALELPAAQLPVALPGPLSPAQADLLKALRARVVELAQRLDMAETTLASRRHLETFVRNLDGPPPAQGDAALPHWRDEVVLPELEDVVARWRQTRSG